MEKIYSKVKPDFLLHIICRVEDFKEGRQDIVPPDEFIQCSMLELNEGHAFRPHKHIWKDGERRMIAQESWVVIEGMVKCILYDINDTIIATPVLTAGDASFTLYGGHTYEILMNGTIVFEYKTGPYKGQKEDKTFIEE